MLHAGKIRVSVRQKHLLLGLRVEPDKNEKKIIAFLGTSFGPLSKTDSLGARGAEQKFNYKT